MSLLFSHMEQTTFGLTVANMLLGFLCGQECERMFNVANMVSIFSLSLRTCVHVFFCICRLNNILVFIQCNFEVGNYGWLNKQTLVLLCEWSIVP